MPTPDHDGLRALLVDRERISGERSYALEMLLPLKDSVQAYLENTLSLPYTSHKWSHAEAVERLCTDLVKRDLLIGMNDSEFLVLILSIWLHDAGMVPARASDLPSITRDRHARRVHDLLKANALDFASHLDERLRYFVADICLNHCEDSPLTLPPSVHYRGVPVRLQLLSALLRLADICDISRDRVPTSIYRTYNFPDASKPHWETHMRIDHVGPVDTPAGTRLQLEAYYTGTRDRSLLTRIVQEVERELAIVAPVFQPHGWTLDDRLDLIVSERRPTRGTTLQAVPEGIYHLLADRLYPSRDVFLRELVQNALDSHKRYAIQCAQRRDTYEPTINVALYMDTRGETPRPLVVRIYDNGIGMDQADVDEYLLRIGNAISRCPDVIQQLRVGGASEELISEFGIGFLTVFPISERVEIYTRKDDFCGLRVTIDQPFLATEGTAEHPVSIDHWPSLEVGNAHTGALAFRGTIVLLYLNEAAGHLDIPASLRTYCRNTRVPVCLSVHDLADADYLASHRHAPLSATSPGCTTLPRYFQGSDIPGAIRVHISNDGPVIDGVLVYSTHSTDRSLVLTLEGILIESCQDLIPDGLRGVTGEVCLKAKSVDLTAGRDQVKRRGNAKFESLVRVLQGYFLELIRLSVVSHPITQTEEPSNITLFLNVLCRSRPRDHEFLRRVFDHVEESVHVSWGRSQDPLPLSTVRASTEQTGVKVIRLQKFQHSYTSHIVASKIDGYEVAVIPRLNEIRCRVPDDRSEMILTVVSAHQPMTLSLDHVSSYCLSEEFYREYFTAHGIQVRQLEVHSYDDMISSRAMAEHGTPATVSHLLAELSLSPFADFGVGARCFIGTYDRRLNVGHPCIKQVLDQYARRLSDGTLSRVDALLVEAYLRVVSVSLPEAIEQLETALRVRWRLRTPVQTNAASPVRPARKRPATSRLPRGRLSSRRRAV